LRPLEVVPVLPPRLSELLALLEEALREGEPVPADFAERLRRGVEAGDLEILAARSGERTLGVAVLAYRLNISSGGRFASIEDLYVTQQARRQGVGRALLRAADERCAERGISYVEVQVEEAEAEAFYTALGYELEKGVRVFSRSIAIAETWPL
jgi:GNAT superfamily N-acetyltransferase